MAKDLKINSRTVRSIVKEDSNLSPLKLTNWQQLTALRNPKRIVRAKILLNWKMVARI